MNNSVKSTGTLVQWIRNTPHCLAMLYFVFYLIAFFSLEQLHTWLHGHDIEEAQGHARTGFTCAGGALDEYGHELPDSCASSPAHADTAASTGGAR